MSELDLLQKAIENSEGKTPQEVLDAFLPKGKKVGGFPLVEVTFGHTLFLSDINHPLVSGKIDDWKAHDIAIALFAFTRSSRELVQLVKDDLLDDKLYDFLDRIPMDEIESSSVVLMAHYYASLKTIIPMESKNDGKAQKKTRSGGS